MTVLLIAGHGKTPQGYFDPGARGYIKIGEHDYFKKILFPLMKKYRPKNGEKVIFYDKQNVYAHGNIVSLARKYGNNTKVIECHFDATTSDKASGGHVIVHKNFKADKLDLSIRDFIKNNIGIFSAYKHLGDIGISGRSDLANVNRTANAGINYRLVELGFGTNEHDSNIMLNKKEIVAKEFMKAIFGEIELVNPISTPSKQEIPQVEHKKLYKVQVGAYSKKENALELQKKIKSKGLDTYLVKEDNLYKVQIGAYSKYENALKMEDKLKFMGFSTYIK